MKNNLPTPPNAPHQQLLVRAINYFRSREGEPRLFTKRKLVLLLLTAAYAFSPIDLIPDFIPGVGQLDDLTVIAFAFLAMFLHPIRKDGSHSHSTVCVSTSLMRIISTVSSCGGSFKP